MKGWTVRFRATDLMNFEAIRDGKKSVETRAATPKYRQVQVGDCLTVVCGDQKVCKQVQSVQIFPSIEAMLKEIPFSQIMPYAKTVEDVQREYDTYPNYQEKIAENGIVAWALAEISSNSGY